MINTITDAITGKYENPSEKIDAFIQNLKSEISEKVSDEILEFILLATQQRIELSYDNWLEYEDDVFIEIYVDQDGERFELFTDDHNWQRREFIKMCHWRYLTSFWVSSVFED